jgi:hydroxymethylpyrimidine pyrophosphatase-like HAD family hydrolase
MPKIIYLTDLDNTLFGSARGMPENHKGIYVGVDKSNKPSPFSSLAQQSFFKMMAITGMVIPVTGRGSEQFFRVTGFPFESFSVVSFGALILNPDGSVNERYREQVVSLIDKHKVSEFDFDFICSEFLNFNKEVKVRVDKDHEILTKAVIKFDREVNQKDLDFAASVLPGNDWRVHYSKRKIEVLPPYAKKENAVAFALKYLLPDADLVIGAGDSVSDLPFMSVCDYAIYPTLSQINEKLKNEQ